LVSHISDISSEKTSHLIAPSLLSANFLNLEKDILMINRSEADWIHLDVMDGLFVPNISFGFPIIEKVRKATSKILDVHLMIVEPERYLERFRKAGADVISIHLEASKEPVSALRMIRDSGATAGIVINPETPVDSLRHVIREADLVLIMSVHPGFGGQSFIPETFRKILALHQLLDNMQHKAIIEVDGGVDLNNAPQLVQAGVNVLVAGNTIFSSDDPLQTIHQLKVNN